MDDFKPSAFTPFLRRFTDERARDLEDTKALYERVRLLHQASPYSAESAAVDLTDNIYADCPPFGDAVRSHILQAIYATLVREAPIFQCPEIDFSRVHLSLKESVDLRHFLRAKEYFHAHEEKVIALLKDSLTRIFSAIAGMLPETFAPSPFTIPLVYALPEPKKFLDQLTCELDKETYEDVGLFVDVSQTILLNVCRISGIANPDDPKKPPIHVPEYDGPLQEIVERYFGGTPFHDFFLAPIPLKFTYEERFSHMHVLGGSGAGKTTLLQNLILNDLQSDKPPSMDASERHRLVACPRPRSFCAWRRWMSSRARTVFPKMN